MISVFIISTTIAVVVSFLCSLSEAVTLSINPLTISRLQLSHPYSAQAWIRLKRNLSRPITAILMLNTVAHTGGATVAGGAFAELYGEGRIWIFSVLFTVVVLFGTEILPKVLGLAFRDQIAPHAGPVLEATTRLLGPLVAASELVFRRLGSERESEQITTADLVTLASVARSGKAIGLEQENIIVNTIRLSHTRVGSAMIPLDRVSFVRQGDSPEAILALARSTGHSRYPVSSSGTAKDIAALIHIKKVVPASPGEVRDLVAQSSPIRTVRQDGTLLAALRTMLKTKQHLLSVTDDRNQCVGIITVEDIAGELVGADIEEFR